MSKGLTASFNGHPVVSYIGPFAVFVWLIFLVFTLAPVHALFVVLGRNGCFTIKKNELGIRLDADSFRRRIA
jgi:hypothetical protein